MLLPSKVDIWWADALTRVYAPWLTSTCVGIGERQRREIVELLDRARRAACLPPIEATAAHPPAPPSEPGRVSTGFGIHGAQRSADRPCAPALLPELVPWVDAAGRAVGSLPRRCSS